MSAGNSQSSFRIKPRSTEENNVDNELLLLLSRQGSRVPLPVFLAMVLIAALASKYLPWPILGAWLTLVFVVLVVRKIVLGRLPEMVQYSPAKRIEFAVWLSAINGITHGISLAYFPYLSDYERALQTLVLAGLCAGAVSTTAGHRTIFFAYLFPTLIPNCLAWLIYGFSDQANWTYLSVFVLCSMFAAIMIALSKDAFRLLNDSFGIRFQTQKLNEQLTEALEHAKQASKAKTRFLASASHDLRQPIHTLSLLGASLSIRPLDERSREITTHMNSAIDALATQLDALLDISKLDAGVIEYEPKEFDLVSLCKRLSKEFGASASQTGSALTFSSNVKSANSFSDPILLERVLRNLISNAIKYGEGNPVEISITEQPATATGRPSACAITVTDHGLGIAEDELKLIFEEFYQVDNPERDRTKGLGLGLAIVKRLLDLLELELSINSNLGSGTSITLTLPVTKRASTVLAFDSGNTFNWNRHKVLVVDDEQMVRFAVQSLLEELGAEVLAASDIPSAVRLAKEHQPDIVLADFRLRGDENGIDAINQIRLINPEIIALLISGDTAPERLQQARNAGIPLLHKPVTVEELESSLKDLFAKQQGEPHAKREANVYVI